MSDYTVCRMKDLQVGDLFLDPVSGALARVTKTERTPGNLRVKVNMTMIVAMSTATLELAENRPMRRRWRQGEQRGQKV